MTSVRNTPAVPRQRTAGPSRCYCGKPLVQTPGKKPRRFCNEACRSASRRDPQGSKRADKSGRLGNRSTEFSKSADQQERGAESVTAATAEERAEAVRVRRYQGRKVLNRVSQIDSCRGCGRRVLDPTTGVIYGRSSRGYVVTIGLVRCGKIWFCPQCSASIRRGRTEELTTAALRWLAAGGTLAVVVLTARHNRTTELARLSDALWGAPLLDAKGAPVLDRSGKARRAPGAYQTMLTAPAFYGRPESVSTWTRKNGTVGTSVRAEVPGIRHRIGYAGMARASEVTRSWENGWHPHMNLLVFLGAHMDGTPAKGTVREYFEPGADSLEEWEDWLRGLWASTLRKTDPTFEPSTECERAGCKCGGKGHGVTVQLVKSPDDKALIEYLTKVQDGKVAPASVDQDVKAAKGAALEVTRGDNKSGRRESMTPFQMLYRLYDLEVSRLDLEDAEGYGTAEQCRAWWAEYETAMAGRRAIEWTRGLRGHVGLKGDDSEEQDLEYVYDPDMQAALTGGVILTEAAATVVVRGDAELDVEACVTAEAYDSVGDLVAALGGYRDHVRVATPEQLAETQENLFARLVARREERESQARIEERKAKVKADWAAKGRKTTHDG